MLLAQGSAEALGGRVVGTEELDPSLQPVQ